VAFCLRLKLLRLSLVLRLSLHFRTLLHLLFLLEDRLMDLDRLVWPRLGQAFRAALDLAWSSKVIGSTVATWMSLMSPNSPWSCLITHPVILW
jgi:hypothetical protein